MLSFLNKSKTTIESPVRDQIIALFNTAAAEYELEYRSTETGKIHTVAFGKLLALRELVTVMGDDVLVDTFSDEIMRLIQSRKSNK